jgi:hypothetical protein
MDSKKLTLWLPADWIEAFRREAEKRGLSVGALMAECTAEQLAKSTRAKLSERRERGRPAKLPS